jgi:hypothetical protein
MYLHIGRGLYGYTRPGSRSTNSSREDPKAKKEKRKKGTRNRRTVRVTWERKSKNGRKEEMCWRYQQRESWNTGCPLFLISTNLIILFYHDCLHVFLRVFLHIFLDVCPHTCLSK